MPIALDTFLSSLYLFSAPFLRMSAMMLVAPVFSAPGLSVRTRVLLATLVAALVAPSLPASNLPDMFSATGLLAAFQEVGVGLMIGFILQLAFGAIVFGAQAMSMSFIRPCFPWFNCIFGRNFIGPTCNDGSFISKSGVWHYH